MSCSVYQLLRFSVEFSLECNKYNPMVCRIPFLLIDDILESSTIRKAENVWKVVELLVDKITLPELFAKGISYPE